MVTSNNRMHYAGDPNLVHVADGRRADMGRSAAGFIEQEIRYNASVAGRGDLNNAYKAPLCPGCYMVVIYNTALELAKQNGQSETELCRSLSLAFAKLADNPNMDKEEIFVCLDSDPR